MNAINDAANSKRVKKYPPIVIDAKTVKVWCADEIILDYWQQKKCSKCVYINSRSECMFNRCKRIV